jgi:hypothetical protein
LEEWRRKRKRKKKSVRKEPYGNLLFLPSKYISGIFSVEGGYATGLSSNLAPFSPFRSLNRLSHSKLEKRGEETAKMNAIRWPFALFRSNLFLFYLLLLLLLLLFLRDELYLLISPRI